MLDFYLIKDTTPNPSHGMSEIDYLGGIEYSEFETVQNEKIIEDHYSYFQDFRWTSEQVVGKLERVEMIKAKGYELIEILRRAKEKGCGVIAYCD